MPEEPAYCDACGVVRGSDQDATWYKVHFGIADSSLMIHATSADIRQLGEHHACSRECLMKLVARWVDEWLPKRKVASA